MARVSLREIFPRLEPQGRVDRRGQCVQGMADHCRIPTIFITAHGDAKMRMQALRAGAVEFMARPFDDEVLLENVRAALES
jgi:FixJ family two-component response regulator